YRIREEGDRFWDKTSAGEYQGAWALVSVSAAEFLDASFRRFPDNLISVDQPSVVYLRYTGLSDASAIQASLTAKRIDDSVVQADQPLAMTQLGKSQQYIGSFYAVPENYTGVVPTDRPALLVAVDDGYAT